MGLGGRALYEINNWHVAGSRSLPEEAEVVIQNIRGHDDSIVPMMLVCLDAKGIAKRAL